MERRKKMEKATTNSLRRRKRSGVVVRLFQHFFQCDMGGYKECFRYNCLLRTEMGEKVRLRGF